MRTLPLLLVIGLAGLADQNHAALSAMADAERAFARAAAERGVRAAFIEFLDDESVGFQPSLGNAKQGYLTSPEPPNPLATSLAWEPRTGAIAASGDLGWLTGPFTLVPRGDVTRTRTGCYSSIWRRAGQGTWRVLVDVGITTPGPCAFAADGFVPLAEQAARFSGPAGTGTGTLRAADAAVARAAAHSDAATALGAVLHDQVRLHRNDRQPIVGRGSAVEWLRSNAAGLAFTPLEAAAATSADLGYTYGRYARGADLGYYLRVWHRAAGGQWAIVADVESPGQ